MLKSGVQKVTGSLFFTYITGLAILFLWSCIFPSYPVLSGFFVQTAFFQGLLLFLNYLIPIHSTGILIAYSLLLVSDTGKIERSSIDFRAIVSPAAILLLVLTLAYTLAVIWWKPAVQNGIDTNISKTVIAKNFFEKAKKAYTQKDYKNAAGFVRYSLSIEPAWKEALALEKVVRKNIITETTPQTEQQSTEQTLEEKSGAMYEELSEGQTTDQIMEKARYFFGSGNYYSSYYWATLVQKLDPNRSDAQSLAVESINKITANELNAAEKEARDFYRKKHDGYTALLNRDYLTAYYIFNELSKKYPDDKDVAEYLAKSKQVVNVLSFFTDEIANIEAFPGIDNILFLNNETDAFKEFVWIGSMIEVKEGTYFKNVESIKISKDGKILSHLRAKYGKYTHASVLKALTETPIGVSDTFINFNCIDRENPTVRYTPIYLKQEEEKPLLGNYLNIVPEISDLRH